MRGLGTTPFGVLIEGSFVTPALGALFCSRLLWIDLLSIVCAVASTPALICVDMAARAQFYWNANSSGITFFLVHYASSFVKIKRQLARPLLFAGDGRHRAPLRPHRVTQSLPLRDLFTRAHKGFNSDMACRNINMFAANCPYKLCVDSGFRLLRTVGVRW